jgi:hypothetical protein
MLPINGNSDSCSFDKNSPKTGILKGIKMGREVIAAISIWTDTETD